MSDINSPTTTVQPAAPAATPSNTGNDDLRGQLARATTEIEALKSQRAREEAERERVVEEQKLKVAASIAKQPSPNIGTAEQDIMFDKAISSVGGLAMFANKLTPAQQADLVHVHVGDTSIDTVKRYFGPGSDPKEANNLGLTNRAEYIRLRGIAKLRRII